MTSVDEFEKRFFTDFETDRGYLRAHYSRFFETKRLFFADKPSSTQPLRVLDVGAHWLHQSLVWRAEGHSVIAADIPATLALQGVIELAKKNDVSLVVYDRLDTGNALAAVASDSVDVVLFAEILEHITFNPVAFWSEIYRVLAPKGRIVVTTPNYYWARGRAWDFSRLRLRMGGGIPVHDILHTPTYGPHWKEYALREIVSYFSMLSSDLVVTKADYVRDPRGLPEATTIRQRFGVFLESAHRIFYWGLHVEVQLKEKKAGIEITPHW